MELFTRNEQQQTPLAESIVNGNDAVVLELLAVGAEKSIFVKGYAAESLVCTLPQARQPKSSVFNHPPPFTQTSPELIAEIDTKLCNHVESLVREEVARTAKENAGAAGLNPDPSLPFNPLPVVLKVGDRVKRLVLIANTTMISLSKSQNYSGVQLGRPLVTTTKTRAATGSSRERISRREYLSGGAPLG